MLSSTSSFGMNELYLWETNLEYLGLNLKKHGKMFINIELVSIRQALCKKTDLVDEKLSWNVGESIAVRC